MSKYKVDPQNIRALKADVWVLCTTGTDIDQEGLMGIAITTTGTCTASDKTSGTAIELPLTSFPVGIYPILPTKLTITSGVFYALYRALS